MHYNLVKKASRAYLEEMSNRAHEQQEVFDCVDTLQATPFKVNVKVLQVAKSVWDKGLTVGKLPSRYSIPFPPKPFDIATNEEARKDYSRKKRAVHDARETQSSKILLFEGIFNLATDYAQYPNIYFPMQYDWRGRIYAVPQYLNYQNNDLARGLLLFSNGKPLGSDDALGRLAIHGANTFGEVDKDTLQARVKWVEENEELILACAREPHSHYEFWGNCSEPYQFLAFCFEWEAFVKHGRNSDFVTHLPCYSDCTNSGLQIFSGLLADERGGIATNLVPSEEPKDVYKEVAEETLRILNEQPDSVLKSMWLEYGVNRYTTKKVTMCIVYGLTQFSCRSYIQEHLEDNVEDGIPNPFKNSGDKLDETPTTFKATQYLSKIVWEALGNVIKSAKEAMIWLQDISKLVADNNLPVTWTTPTGFIVQMICPKMETRRINTNMGEKIWRPKLNKFVDDIRKTTIQVETDKVDKKKMSNSIAPCYVHSLDASVLQKAVCKASDAGIKSFACIHDSFGVLAPDVSQMNYSLREAFVEIFDNKNLLDDFVKEIRLQIHKDKRDIIPATPAKGSLDISKIINSLYFCS